ncbi:MAG: hypothetical protein K2W96_00565 [Gemmataceae bacterium]|nr:hypothetical protein [Gemmataceae bacterium]
MGGTDSAWIRWTRASGTGRHDLPKAVKFLPGQFDWLDGRLAAYTPR